MTDTSTRSPERGGAGAEDEIPRPHSFEELPAYVLATATHTVRKHPAVVWAWGLLRLDVTGLAFAALFFCWSLTPSLLPRGWLFQGIVSGITAAIGYGVGVAVGWVMLRTVLRQQPWWPLPARVERAIVVAVPIVGVVAGAVMLYASAEWQRQLAALMNAEGLTSTGFIRTGIISLVVAGVLIGLWRVIRDFRRFLVRNLLRLIRLPQWVANLVGFVLVIVVLVTLVQGVLLRGTMSVANSVFSTQNGNTREGAEQPTVPERSGGPGSVVEWDSLGFEGRNFVSGGLDAEEMRRATGRESKEAIRVYAGLESAETSEERMDLLIQELDRTDAFSRRAVVVIPTTGTGWVNPTAARAVELMYEGDVALVASQYSYLPSWISFLADREKAAAAGKNLIDRVHARWEQEPAPTRPKLYVYGESLGTQAGEGAFADIADIRSTVDGVLWVGPPNSNRIWSTYVDRRDPGTPEVEPVYAGGLLMRFADSTRDVEALSGEWPFPRVLYIQHPSDPIVWWTPDLLFQRPDWLAEPPGYDRLPSMRWFPFVTFWQVSADLTNAAGVPDGHGHNYGTTVLDGFAAVAAPEGWTQADTERIRAVMVEYADADGPEK
ncbi:alpha/beta hydrolase [Rhodococcoides kroppenstedtii]|uniref:alpha/beta hydrolase n=1 Tax=Rhodococcoides kroppenstedtii TaxID=293050 RepID=UPI0036427F9D